VSRGPSVGCSDVRETVWLKDSSRLRFRRKTSIMTSSPCWVRSGHTTTSSQNGVSGGPARNAAGRCCNEQNSPKTLQMCQLNGDLTLRDQRRHVAVLPSSSRERVGVLILRFSRFNSPDRYPCLRFKRHVAMPPARLRAKMESLSPSCRTLSLPATCQRNPAPLD
jgi:hypothetical protein